MGDINEYDNNLLDKAESKTPKIKTSQRYREFKDSINSGFNLGSICRVGLGSRFFIVSLARYVHVVLLDSIMDWITDLSTDSDCILYRR